MTGRMRVVVAVAIGVMGFAAQAQGQITGMPLFTNPRYGTGLRVHADIGQPADSGVQPGKLSVVQVGATLAIGSLGIGINGAIPKSKLSSLSACTSSTPLLNNCDPTTKFTGSALAQLRVVGGGLNPLALSIFGGVSADFGAYDVGVNSSLPVAQIPLAQRVVDSLKTKELTIPVGAALGIHIPLGFLSVNLWGAPRYNLHKFANCGATNAAQCSGKMTGTFRWAAGADIPLLGILGVRAAYDSGKIGNRTVNYWGVGVSVGFGGMR